MMKIEDELPYTRFENSLHFSRASLKFAGSIFSIPSVTCGDSERTGYEETKTLRTIGIHHDNIPGRDTGTAVRHRVETTLYSK